MPSLLEIMVEPMPRVGVGRIGVLFGEGVFVLVGRDVCIASDCDEVVIFGFDVDVDIGGRLLNICQLFITALLAHPSNTIPIVILKILLSGSFSNFCIANFHSNNLRD